MSARRRPARRLTPTAVSCSSRRAARPRYSARRCWSRARCSAPGAWIATGPGATGAAQGGPPVPGARRPPSARRSRRPGSARGDARATGEPSTQNADESLEMARGRKKVADPPTWFGVIRPSRLLVHLPPEPAGRRAPATSVSSSIRPRCPRADEEEGAGRESKILKLFENPLFNSTTLAEFCGSCSAAPVPPATAPPARSYRSAPCGGRTAPEPKHDLLPTRIRFTMTTTPASAVGVGGALYPEWDVHNNRYRPRWCRVIDFP